jgi:hypothetical protein
MEDRRHLAHSYQPINDWQDMHGFMARGPASATASMEFQTPVGDGAKEGHSLLPLTSIAE